MKAPKSMMLNSLVVLLFSTNVLAGVTKTKIDNKLTEVITDIWECTTNFGQVIEIKSRELEKNNKLDPNGPTFYNLYIAGNLVEEEMFYDNFGGEYSGESFSAKLYYNSNNETALTLTTAETKSDGVTPKVAIQAPYGKCKIVK